LYGVLIHLFCQKVRSLLFYFMKEDLCIFFMTRSNTVVEKIVADDIDSEIDHDQNKDKRGNFNVLHMYSDLSLTIKAIVTEII